MEIIRNKDRTVTLMASCRLCGDKYLIKVRPQDLVTWNEGAHCQDAFPYLTPGEREMLISHTCDKCWSKIFSDDDTGDIG